MHLGTLALLRLVLGSVLTGDSRAGSFLDHVGISSESGLAHQTHPGALEVSSAFSIEVTADTARSVLQHLGGNDFDLLTIEEDSQVFNGVVDSDDIVVGVEDDQFNNIRRAGGSLDVGLSLGDGDSFLVQFDSDFAASGLEFDDVGTAEDLDDLLVSLGLSAQDSQRSGQFIIGSTILEDQMLTFVDLISVGLVVKGGDGLRVDPAAGRVLIATGLLHDSQGDSVSQTQGHDVSQSQRHSDILKVVDDIGTLDMDLDGVSNAAESAGQFVSVAFSRSVFFNVDLGEEIGLKGSFDLVEERNSLPGLRDAQSDPDLVSGTGLVSDFFADGRQRHVLAQHLLAHLELIRRQDGSLEFLRLGPDRLKGQLLLFLVLVAIGQLGVEFHLDVLVDQRVNVPSEGNLGQDSPGLKIDLIDGHGFSLEQHMQQSLVGVVIGLLSSNQNNSLEGLVSMSRLQVERAVNVDSDDLTDTDLAVELLQDLLGLLVRQSSAFQSQHLLANTLLDIRGVLVLILAHALNLSLHFLGDFDLLGVRHDRASRDRLLAIDNVEVGLPGLGLRGSGVEGDLDGSVSAGGGGQKGVPQGANVVVAQLVPQLGEVEIGVVGVDLQVGAQAEGLAEGHINLKGRNKLK